MTNSRSIVENRKTKDLLINCDCESISAYDDFRGVQERLFGCGVLGGGDGLISSAVSGHIICVASSFPSPGATISGESGGW